MCDLDNAELFTSGLIDGETSKKVASSRASKYDAHLGISQNDVHRALELAHEGQSKFDICSCGLEGCCVTQLVKRGRNYDQLHLSAARTRASASAIGMSLTEPLSTSATRRSTSAAQASSISTSSSRLASNRCASAA